MDGNSAKKAPVLDHLVDTKNSSTVKPTPAAAPTQQPQSGNKPVLASMNGVHASTQDNSAQEESEPKNRRTDKSEFEIELTKTVNRIMLKHFEDASEEIVSQVLSEVRARLPGQRKN